MRFDGRSATVVLLLLAWRSRALRTSDGLQIVRVYTYNHTNHSVCPILCTGTMMSPVMVLTAASCTGELYGNSTATAVTNGKIKVSITSLGSKPSAVRNVTHKFVHPEWNSETHVGDLALLKMARTFSEIHLLFVITPILVWANVTPTPWSVKFKGFGKTKALGDPVPAVNATTTHELTDGESLRTLKVRIAESSCPLPTGDGGLKADPNWWSFLCTDAPDVRTEVNNTLCEGDVGGPLFNIIRDPHELEVVMYGLFSHAYHVTQPHCEMLCYNSRESAPFPCNHQPGSAMYYKHTVLGRRYTDWVKRTMSLSQRASTARTVERDCPEMMTGGPDVSTDPYYDADVHVKQVEMVANRWVCAESATVPGAAARTPPVVMLAAAVALSRH